MRSRRTWTWYAAALLLPVAFWNVASAQEYVTRVVAKDLKQPTGITVNLWGQIFFTQLPNPGVSGQNGGKNTVSQLNPRNGRVRDLVVGEPEPTNLATTFFGELYWTCKSAGVINTLERGEVMTILRGLSSPTGISAFPFGFGLFFTEVPTPAVSGANGGENAVSFAFEDGSFVLPLDEGDPEPNDVVIDLDGDIYWTCTSAGVIVRLSNGKTEVILRDLDRPTGIAVDYVGNLYFTEVPTPGVSGANGGSNKVWRYDLKQKKLILIDEGDPEPTDVTALPDGTVYWTCTSAGVIVEAKPRRRGR